MLLRQSLFFGSKTKSTPPYLNKFYTNFLTQKTRETPVPFDIIPLEGRLREKVGKVGTNKNSTE